LESKTGVVNQGKIKKAEEEKERENNVIGGVRTTKN
jgi:hypothetical protein